MVSLMRFERMTSRLGIVCSIQLSYKDKSIKFNDKEEIPPKKKKGGKKNYFLPFLAGATASLRPFPALNFGTYLSLVLYFLFVPGTVPSFPF